MEQIKNYISAALPTIEQSRDEYIGSVYGAAALATVASIAHEQAAYVERRAEKFTLFTVEMRDRCKRSVSWVLRTMSCRGIDHSLRLMAEGLLERHLPDGFDLLADQSVRIGCQAVLNIMADVDTWVFAREKAERLNK